MLPHDAELAGVVQRCVVLPRTESMRVVLRRAQGAVRSPRIATSTCLPPSCSQ